MLADDKEFEPLPWERILFKSPARTTLSLQSSNSFPGKQPFSVQSSGGVAYLTNQRIVYLPTTPTPQLQSFSAPILNLQDAHVSAPFFGPNVWIAVLQPVTGGGIPPQHAYIEMKMTFKDGGAFDFHTTFEEVKASLSHALEIARESGHTTGQTSNIDLSNVHLDQLPAYEEAGGNVAAPAQQIFRPVPISVNNTRQPPSTGQGSTVPASNESTTGEQFVPPDEPPPGYEEAQASSLVNHLEERVRREST